MTGSHKSVASEMARRGLLSAIHSGMDPEDFHRLSGISEIDAHQPGGRISENKYICMLNLIERLNNPCSLITPPDTDYWAEPFATTIGIVATAPHLVSAFEKCIEYRALIGEVDAMSFKQAGAEFEFEFHLDGNGRTPMMALRSFEGILRLAEGYGGKKIYPSFIELVGNAVPAWSRLEHSAQCKLLFGQARNRMVFSAPWANNPHQTNNPFLYSLLCNKAEYELRGLRGSHSFSFRVEAFLTDLLQKHNDRASGNGAMLLTCDRFQLSRSALHRRLQKENTNFQTIMVRARLLVAKRLLIQQQYPIAEIGDMLGFSSPAVFSRFFSDQTGIPPSQYKSSGPVL